MSRYGGKTLAFCLLAAKYSSRKVWVDGFKSEVYLMREIGGWELEGKERKGCVNWG